MGPNEDVSPRREHVEDLDDNASKGQRASEGSYRDFHRSKTFTEGTSRTSREGTDEWVGDPDIALAKAPTRSSRSLMHSSSILSAMPAGVGWLRSASSVPKDLMPDIQDIGIGQTSGSDGDHERRASTSLLRMRTASNASMFVTRVSSSIEGSAALISRRGSALINPLLAAAMENVASADAEGKALFGQGVNEDDIARIYGQVNLPSVDLEKDDGASEQATFPSMYNFADPQEFVTDQDQEGNGDDEDGGDGEDNIGKKKERKLERLASRKQSLRRLESLSRPKTDYSLLPNPGGDNGLDDKQKRTGIWLVSQVPKTSGTKDWGVVLEGTEFDWYHWIAKKVAEEGLSNVWRYGCTPKMWNDFHLYMSEHPSLWKGPKILDDQGNWKPHWGALKNENWMADIVGFKDEDPNAKDSSMWTGTQHKEICKYWKMLEEESARFQATHEPCVPSKPEDWEAEDISKRESKQDDEELAGLRGQKSVSFLHKRGLPSPPSAQKLAEIKKTAAFGRNVPLADTPLSGPSTRNSDSGSFGGGYDRPRTSTGRGSVDLLSRNSPGDESGLRRRGGSLDMARPSSFLHHHHPQQQQQQQESIPEADEPERRSKSFDLPHVCMDFNSSSQNSASPHGDCTPDRRTKSFDLPHVALGFHSSPQKVVSPGEEGAKRVSGTRAGHDGPAALAGKPAVPAANIFSSSLFQSSYASTKKPAAPQKKPSTGHIQS